MIRCGCICIAGMEGEWIWIAQKVMSILEDGVVLLNAVGWSLVYNGVVEAVGLKADPIGARFCRLDSCQYLGLVKVRGWACQPERKACMEKVLGNTYIMGEDTDGVSSFHGWGAHGQPN